MKTINEILDETAVKNGYNSIDNCLSVASPLLIYKVTKEAMKAYATMAIEEQKKICAEKAHAYATYDDFDGTYDGVVAKNSILNAPNVELK